jgi:BASS family bile acid:Na+ symporter
MNSINMMNLLIVVGLIAMMLSMGFKVTLEEVAATISKPRLVVSGLVANFVLVPAATLGLLYLFDPDGLVAVGFLILAVCPAAPVGPPFAAVAKADVPYATGQMVILAGLSSVLAPVLLSAFLPWLLPASDLRIEYMAIVRTLLVSQMLPLAAGLAFHHYAPKLTGQIARPVGLLANLLLLGVFALVLVREYETLATIRLRGWFGMSLLVAASLAIGWLFGGPCRSRRKALAVTTAVRNAAVALVIVSSNFAQTAAVTAVVAYALVSIFATFGFALLLAAVPESTGEKSNGRRPELAAGDRLLTPLSDSTVRSKTT